MDLTNPGFFFFFVIALVPVINNRQLQLTWKYKIIRA